MPPPSLDGISLDSFESRVRDVGDGDIVEVDDNSGVAQRKPVSSNSDTNSNTKPGNGTVETERGGGSNKSSGTNVSDDEGGSGNRDGTSKNRGGTDLGGGSKVASVGESSPPANARPSASGTMPATTQPGSQVAGAGEPSPPTDDRPSGGLAETDSAQPGAGSHKEGTGSLPPTGKNGQKRGRSKAPKTGSAKGAKEKGDSNKRAALIDKKKIDAMKGKRKGTGPTVAGTHNEKVSRQGKGTDDDYYKVPDHSTHAEFGVRLDFQLVCDTHEGEDALPWISHTKRNDDGGLVREQVLVRDTWKEDEDYYIYALEWSRVCKRLRLSDATFRGESDPDGMARWKELMERQQTKKKPASGKRKTTAAKKAKAVNSQMLAAVKQPRASSVEQGEEVPGVEGETAVGIVGNVADSRDTSEDAGPQGAGGASGSDSSGAGVRPGVTDSSGSQGVADSSASQGVTNSSGSQGVTDSSGGQGVADSRNGSKTSGTRGKGRRLGSQVHHANSPTPFILEVKTDDQGCKHNGAQQLVGFTRSDYKHYIQKGAFLDRVGRCKYKRDGISECGVAFDEGYKPRTKAVEHVVYGCKVGKRCCGKKTLVQGYDEECFYAHCLDCHIIALSKLCDTSSKRRRQTRQG